MKRLVLLGLLLATPAFAHARLVSSDPAANAKVKSPGQIKLHFSESLEPAFSAASLTDSTGKTVPVSKSVGADTITLLPLTLKPGAYKVTWHSVGQDTHRLTGSFGFTVIP
jgi:methionine-rich copper-binding protein CopC